MKSVVLLGSLFFAGMTFGQQQDHSLLPMPLNKKSNNFKLYPFGQHEMNKDPRLQLPFRGSTQILSTPAQSYTLPNGDKMTTLADGMPCIQGNNMLLQVMPNVSRYDAMAKLNLKRIPGQIPNAAIPKVQLMDRK